MDYRHLPIYVITCLLGPSAMAQQPWFRRDTMSVLLKDDVQASLSWVGGLNAAQYHKTDLNGDTMEDLVLFDRTNSKFTVMLAEQSPDGAWRWTHKPEYEAKFPVVHNWIFLADYDGDGHKDLFASTSLGIQLFRFDQSTAGWKWTQVRQALYTKGFSGFINLQISGSDIPAIVDLDGDGDLDVLGFDYSGTYIELHQNMSIERFGVPDSLGTETNPVFVRNGDCWGDFSKNSAQQYVLGGDCRVVENPDNGRVMHSGNSILVEDLNGDGKKDLIVGHISSKELSVFYNGRAGINASFTSYIGRYPEKDPAAMHIFPAAFTGDLDMDGIKDMVVAPNLPSGDAGLTDFRASNWLYKNYGSNDSVDFRLASKDFLQGQMLDVGENSAPAFLDIDGDGDPDLLVGTGPQVGQTGLRGGVFFYENTGSKTKPVFVLRSEDYLGIGGRMEGYNFKPQWADFDGNGTIDLGLVFSTPRGLRAVYYSNSATTGKPIQLSSNSAIDIALPASAYTGDTPFFVDADHDGDLDLLLGKAQGNLHYYMNEGTPRNPLFKLETENIASIGISFEKRYLQAIAEDFDRDGNLDLLTVDYSGKMRVYYNGDWGKWRSSETVRVESETEAPILGQMLHAAATDLNGDGKIDLAVGSNAGGLQLFENMLPLQVSESDQELFKVFPNPARRFVRMLASKPGRMTIFNLKGQAITTMHLQQGQLRRLQTQDWASGLYVFSFETDNKISNVKVAIVD